MGNLFQLARDLANKVDTCNKDKLFAQLQRNDKLQKLAKKYNDAIRRGDVEGAEKLAAEISRLIS